MMRRASEKQARYRIVRDAARPLPPDVAPFINLLGALDTHPLPEARALFEAGAELIIARAPGRLDVMGGIADYSGSLVLELPIADATLVALERDEARTLKIVSLSKDTRRGVSLEMPLTELEEESGPIGYEAARDYFRLDPNKQWAAYVAGVFLVLMRERAVRFADGARLLIWSGVPEGKGVSSSAALEVAVMTAVAAAFDLDLAPRELALLCQQVENRVVGAPCGIMDQMTVACGTQDRLLALLCQPAEIIETISVPEEIAVWGLDSGVRHCVGGGDYGSVRTGAFMGYRIIAELAGLNVTRRATTTSTTATTAQPPQLIEIDDSRWHGYLANLAPAEYEQHYAARLPDQISGVEFLARYGGTTDPVTQIDPARRYAVRHPTAHAVYEHFRVRAFAELLRGEVNERRRELLGELMYQSHASYSACGLGSAGTDLLVELVKTLGPAHGLYGAKITGGGSGGTIAVIGRRGADQGVAAVAKRYAGETGHEPYLFAGSSPGSASFGHLRIRRNTE